MSDLTIANQSGIDVAMFIDWENMHSIIRGKANVSALREVAEGYGRLVVCKAYADWRETRFQQDSFVLYQIGFEPVYVPSGFKNNVDVKLASDCVDLAYKYPNIGIFILVTGDGDFIHVATTLRPLGKKVIVIAQSNNASSRLGDLVDTLLIYEQDVSPASTDSPPKKSKKKQSRARLTIEDVYKDIVDIIESVEGAPILLTNVKDRLIRANKGFDQRDYGFTKFKTLVEKGVEEGYFVLNTAGLRDWLILPKEDLKTAEVPLPDNLDEILAEVDSIIKSSNKSQVVLAYIKNSLIRKYGGFDESVYGFGQFRQLMEEGKRLGLFELGIGKNKVDYAFIPKIDVETTRKE